VQHFGSETEEKEDCTQAIVIWTKIWSAWVLCFQSPGANCCLAPITASIAIGDRLQGSFSGDDWSVPPSFRTDSLRDDSYE